MSILRAKYGERLADLEPTNASCTYLYGDSFSPLTPLSQALVANDDASNTAFNVSGFSWNLTAGRSYTYVVTGFDNDEYGSFRTTIESVAAPVPEPSTWLLLAAGLGCLMAGVRRRSSARAQSAGSHS